MTTEAEAQKMVDEHAMKLGEHFDAVLILVSRGDPNDPTFTQLVAKGRGSWFAQRGMVEEVLHNDQAKRIAVNLKSQPFDGGLGD